MSPISRTFPTELPEIFLEKPISIRMAPSLIICGRISPGTPAAEMMMSEFAAMLYKSASLVCLKE